MSCFHVINEDSAAIEDRRVVNQTTRRCKFQTCFDL